MSLREPPLFAPEVREQEQFSSTQMSQAQLCRSTVRPDSLY